MTAGLTVLGIGSVLRRDEGVGVRLMEAVRDARSWPEAVEFVDGGVGGLNLLTVIERAQRLVVLDAAEMSLPAGQWRIVAPEQVLPDNAAASVSLHDVSFIQTLELCREHLSCPPTTILAIQPGDIEYGLELSPAMKAAMAELTLSAVALVQRELAESAGAASPVVEPAELHPALLRDLLPQLHAVARAGGLSYVTRLHLVVGSLYGMDAPTLREQLLAALEDSAYEDAAVEVTVVEPGMEMPAPGRSDIMITTGWEILVVRLEGRGAS